MRSSDEAALASRLRGAGTVAALVEVTLETRKETRLAFEEVHGILVQQQDVIRRMEMMMDAQAEALDETHKLLKQQSTTIRDQEAEISKQRKNAKEQAIEIRRQKGLDKQAKEAAVTAQKGIGCLQKLLEIQNFNLAVSRAGLEKPKSSVLDSLSHHSKAYRGRFTKIETVRRRDNAPWFDYC